MLYQFLTGTNNDPVSALGAISAKSGTGFLSGANVGQYSAFRSGNSEGYCRMYVLDTPDVGIESDTDPNAIYRMTFHNTTSMEGYLHDSVLTIERLDPIVIDYTSGNLKSRSIYYGTVNDKKPVKVDVDRKERDEEPVYDEELMKRALEVAKKLSLE